MNRYLSGNHLALDVSSFACNERTLSLSLTSNLCPNSDGSHNKMLHNSFFDEVQSMIKQIEALEINKWKEKWSDLANMISDATKINDILNHKILPHIAGWGVSTLFKRTPVACKACVNKLTYGIGEVLHFSKYGTMPCNVECIAMRDEDGLRWPSKIIAILTGVIIKVFQRFLDCENCTNDYCISCSSSRVCLLTLKGIMHNVMHCSAIFNAWKGQCNLCNCTLMKKAIIPLENSHINVAANNFALVLNRRAMQKSKL